MGRNLVVQLQKLNRKLYAEQHEADLEVAAANEGLAYASPGTLQESEAQENVFGAESRQLVTKLALKRAQFFGVRLARGPDPYCISCFVRHDVHPTMKVVDNIISSITKYKCTRCGSELNEDEPIIDVR